MARPRIGIITDFGDRDGFVGIMKGKLVHMLGEVDIIDIAHQVPPHDVRHASWVLKQCFLEYPQQTVFLVMVDPEVGSIEQRPVVVYWDNWKKAVVCPDNGVVSRILGLGGPRVFRYDYWQVLPKQNRKIMRETYFGREIYSTVAGRMAASILRDDVLSVALAEQEEISREDLKRYDFNDWQALRPRRAWGEIDIVDRFGNLITTIDTFYYRVHVFETSNKRKKGKKNKDDIPLYYQTAVVHCGGQTVTMPLVRSYEALSQYDPPLGILIGWHGQMEIAYYQGSAYHHLRWQPGDSFICQFSQFAVMHRQH